MGSYMPGTVLGTEDTVEENTERGPVGVGKLWMAYGPNLASFMCLWAKNGFYIFKRLKKKIKRIFYNVWKLCEIQIPGSINKVLLEQSHAPFTYGLGLLPHYNSSVEQSQQRPYGQESLKCLLAGSSGKKKFLFFFFFFVNPCSRNLHSLWRNG